MGIPLFPLSDGRCCGVQVVREHRLAEFQFFTQAFDVAGREIVHGRRADGIELTHRHFVDGPGFVKRGQIVTQGFNDFAHNAPGSS